MSEYCDYNKDKFLDCLVKDKELCNDFLDMLSPTYRAKARKNENRNKFIDTMNHMINAKRDQFAIDSCGIQFQEVKGIAENNNLYCEQDIENDRYLFRIKS